MGRRLFVFLFPVCLLVAALIFIESTYSQANPGMSSVEGRLEKADGLWRDTSLRQALPLYRNILETLPEECEPFRTLVIMRIADACFALGDNAGCIAALDLMTGMEYVPEHHALAAKELRAVIAGESHPGYRKTGIPPVGETGATIYVDVAAAQNGDGSRRSPVRSLNEAVGQARTVRANGKNGRIEIILAPGIYRQKKTVELTREDSGLAIRSADPEHPAVLSGGTALATWKPVTDVETLNKLPESVRSAVMVCDLKSHGIDSLGDLTFGGFSSKRSAGGNHSFKTFPVPELFYDGEPQTMARWPNDGFVFLPIDSEPEENGARFARWAGETDLWLYGYWYWDWADAYEKVAGISESGKITLAPPTNSYGFRLNKGYAVNALSEIDMPGEWHLDTGNGRIHYLPPEGFDPAQCVLSSYGTVIAAENCRDLQIRDIRIEYIRGNALTTADCSDLVLAGIAIRNCSGLGIQALGGKHHLIHSCTISSMGRGGIRIQAGDWQTLDPSYSVIENCSISNISRIDHTYTPALLLEGMGLKVRHNAFENIPSSAIRLEACDALIELNYFHRCVYESGDQGAIDMWANPLYRGNVIRWNDFDRIINESGGKYGAAGIRHDDFISGFMVSENVFRKGSEHGFGSVQFNQGTDTYVEGNIIIDWQKAFTGRAVTGPEWKQKITGHGNSNRVLSETDWQSEAWQKKYPKLRDLFNGDDNTDYLVDNQRCGTGAWGGVQNGIMFANVEGSADFHGDTLESVKTVLVPWHPIPLDLIGRYDQ